ncbi:xanthine dehydrogenase family protein molybdopterin-binding subunit [Desulfohalovibrio reitneri]|uniref:xanthine dehydrogenase family protein molybdopterin-binding subunit n=1 Tax=Desulfohalovibrio reitneri TaxID=1307759 RepID=UPI0004A6B869|nr:xanthine dehydrogenase family protein molybdopterin-binding subunit [Desulfohalovibrio reitneri]
MAKNLYFDPVASHPQPGESGKPPAWLESTSVVGERTVRVDAYERVTGTAVYPSDVRLPDMLYGAILGCPHPHAKLTRLDTAEAARTPGVRDLISHKTSGANPKWPWTDQGEADDAPESVTEARLFDTELFFEGEAVCAVAADTPQACWDALRKVKAEYEKLPFVSHPVEALTKGAPKARPDNPDGNRASPPQTYSRGNVERGFSEASAVVERDYLTRCLLHTPLEPHGAAAAWDGDELTIWESTQGVYAVREKVAQVLGLPLSKVRVLGHYVGGGFGSKLETSKYSIMAALLAKRTGRPVKLFLPREQTYLTMGNRPESAMRLKMGADGEGRLTAISFEGTGASGAFPSGGTSLLDWLAKDLYACGNVETRLNDVLINAQPARPFRAPGYPQCSWAVEQAVDELARKLDMDPVELRLKNIPDRSQGREGQPPYTTTGLAECLRRGAEAFDWAEARKRTREQDRSGRYLRGVGAGACNWFLGNGFPPSTVIVSLNADGTVVVNAGASDIGTGSKTVFAVVAAEEMGVTPESVRVENADTGTTHYSRPSGGSKTLPTDGSATRLACVDLKRKLLDWAAEDLDAPRSGLLFRGANIQTYDETKKIAVTDLSHLKSHQTAIGIGHKSPGPDGKVVVPFGAQFCEVEVDRETGEVRLTRFVASHDSGRVIDRLTYDNQVGGGIVMGIGLGMLEERVLDGPTGKLCTRNWHDYKLPTIMDAPPEILSEPIEMPDPEANAIGGKGLGEPVTVPTAAVIANAVFDACGVRLTESPVNAPALVAALAGRKEAA